MTTDHTAPELLEAVGYDWRTHYGRESRPSYEIGGDNTAYFAASNEIKYTGPALGTPELDALLLVAGQRWLRANIKRRVDVYTAVHKMNGDGNYTTVASVALWLFEICDTPGHALARAIREVSHA